MEILYELNIISTLFRLSLALICGGILGIERGRKNRPAGFRTYMLVSVASTMVMITNEYIAQLYPASDPARMGAQVISGIGFLGAGTIIVTGRNKVRGLTTAAGLWASACAGLAIGVGYYSAAVIASIMVFITMAFLDGIDDKVISFNREITIYVELSSIRNLSEFFGCIKDNNMKIIDLELIKTNNCDEYIVGVIVSLKLLDKSKDIDAIEVLSKSEGVCSIQEI